MRTNAPPRRPTTTTQDASAWPGVIANLLAVLPTWAWDAWVGKAVWNWFVPSIFRGAPRLSTPSAAGLMLVVVVFSPRRPSNPPDGDPVAVVVVQLMENLLLGAMVLVGGYVLHRFV